LQKLWRRLKFWLKFLNLFVWPLTLKDDLYLDLLPLKMCSSMRYTCMPNIKLLCSIFQVIAKLYCKVKVLGQNDRQKDRQTGQKQYTPDHSIGGHKKY
jgi:hypothetical protein